MSANQSGSRLATRLAFLVAGFGIACWAPLVPIVKQHLNIDEGLLGLLLLCLGVGSIFAMVMTGFLSGRYGSRPIIMAGGLGLVVMLPLLTLASSPIILAAALLVFGASLGAIDVAMNIHAVEVERHSDKPLMSGFHALFSVGGFIGAGAMTLLLSSHVNSLLACVLCSVLMLVAMLIAWPRLLPTKESHDGPIFVIPKGAVLLLAILAGIMFLVEGAMLDWSALLITETGRIQANQGGIGYMLFAIAMTIGRFSGDAITARFGDRAVMFWGGLIALAGFVLLLAVPITVVSLCGFILIGLGASNVVPVLFRRAGTQTVMSPSLAVAAISTVGYAGILVGPAFVGFVADIFSLPISFWLLAALLIAVPLCAHKIVR